MATEYQLSYTASEINQKLGMVDTLNNTKLNASELPSAIENALSEAKASGEFDGAGISEVALSGNYNSNDGATNSYDVIGSDGSLLGTINVKNGTKGNAFTYADFTTEQLNALKGKDGTSVTVSKVSESTADGGSNVVTFSDGKTLTVKNGAKGSDGAAGKTPVKGTDYWTAADKEELILAVAESSTATEKIPSPNLVNINDTESWPFGISETESVKGLYSWVDSEGYIRIRGTATENNTIFLLFDEGYKTFEPGTYYICFDDVLKTGSQNATINWNGTETFCKLNDSKPMATVTLTENLSVNKVDVYFTTGSVVDFKGHCWITKNEPFDYYAPKGGTVSIPITPVKKEDIDKLDDYNVLGIFDSIGGVGDSLTSGYINPTSDSSGENTTCYPKSWLSQVKKIVGVDIEHFSYGGATTKNWLQNQNNCYTDILTKPCEAYFLALGTNDSSDWANISVGTIDDMGTNTESFYGLYSKVISRIREANPNAPIFMLSMYWTGFEAYNNAIKAMSEATKRAYYIDITDMDDKYGKYRQGYHFNAIGYYYIAKSIIQRTSDVILSNHQDFANLGVTGDVLDGGSGGSSGGGSGDSGTTTPSYNNVLSTSIGTDGAVFNDGKGWSAGRFGSDGTERDNTGSYITGFIRVDPGAYLYLKNITMPVDASNYGNGVFYYDANKQKIMGHYLTNDKSSVYQADSNNNIVKILVDPFYTDTVYVRLSAALIDDTSIITVNEPID